MEIAFLPPAVEDLEYWKRNVFSCIVLTPFEP